MSLWGLKTYSLMLSPTNFVILMFIGVTTQCFAEDHLKRAIYTKHFTSPFLKDLILVDNFYMKNKRVNTKSRRSAMNFQFSSYPSQEQVGSFIYKAIDDPKKFAENSAAATIFTGLELLGASESIKSSIKYIKEKIRYKFGKCGKLKLTSKVRAESCLTESASIELKSKYNFKDFTFSFKWAL
ncbi:MAG: hypothetical protein PUP46_09815 [Endozoicomonas sp. (ex Botrylloides leachii)]|nr:hypothetical protein [Endozoicomonas sp. (ex Botrylloides leachii)]